MVHTGFRRSRRRRGLKSSSRVRRGRLARLGGLRRKRFTLAKKVNKLMRAIEVKTFDTLTTALAFPNAATGEYVAVPIALMPVGSNLFERIGNKIMIKNIQVVGHFRQAAASTLRDAHIKILVVRDMAYQGGAVPAWVEIFNRDGEDWTSATRRPALFARYKILATKRITFRASGALTSNDKIIPFKMFIPLRGNAQTYRYIANTAVKEALDRGAIFLMAAYDIATGVIGNSPQVKWTTRVKFTDT